MVDPISTNLPGALASFGRKYTEPDKLGNYLGAPELRPLMQMDYNRVTRGAYPIPLDRTRMLLDAIRTGESQIEKKSKGGVWGFLENVQKDVESFVRAVPHIPGAVINEIKELPQIGEKISEELNKPGADIGDIFRAPGLRLLPGSYLASEGLHVIGEHPLFAAADVAPYVGKLGSAAKLGTRGLKLAEKVAPKWTDAALRGSEAVRYSGDTARLIAQQERLALKQAAGQAVDVGTIRRSAFEAITDTMGVPRSQLGQQTVRSGWTEWIPGTRFREPIMVPDPVKKAFDKQFITTAAGPGARAMGKAMGVYRTSILPLSPRWHIYNVIGGGILTAARGDLSMLRHIRRAWRMSKNGGAEMPLELSRGWVSASGNEALEKEAIAEFSRGGALGKAVNKVTGGAWDAAERIDSFYRSLSYLHHSRKAARKGNLEAREVGIREANKVLQDWDAMRPWERQVLRTIFPFYGWMKHIAKYVSTYPVDHPLRTSIMAAFARNEIKDWKSGLPLDFQNYLPLGGTDREGNQQMLNLRGANPFSDVGNLFTLGGFLSQLNPVATGLLEAAGLNTLSGRAELYPDVEFDENTGRLVAKQPSLGEALAGLPGQFVPQGKAIANLLGFQTPDERQMRYTNPEAARQAFWSQFGVPTPRTVNKPLETAQAEYRRMQEMQGVLTTAKKTGDYTDAMRYPFLRPIVAQILAAEEAGALEGYKVQPKPAGVQSDQILRLLTGA